MRLRAPRGPVARRCCSAASAVGGTCLFLAVGLVGVAAAHSTSAVVVAALVLVAPARRPGRPARRGPERAASRAARLVERRDRAAARCTRPWLACVLGAGVIGAPAGSRVARSGAPVSYRFLDPDWLDRASLEHYYGRAVPRRVARRACVLVLTSRRLRRDPALLAAGVARARVRRRRPTLARRTSSFDYQRVVYYFGVGLALLIGAAFTRRKRPRRLGCGLRRSCSSSSHGRSVGTSPSRARRAVRAARSGGLRSHLVPGEARPRRTAGFGANRHATRVSTSPCRTSCAGRRFPRSRERQVGFVDRLPLARQAPRSWRAGRRELRWRRASACGYAVADPECAPDLETRLGGTTVVANDGPGRHPAAAGALRLTRGHRRARAGGSPLSRETSERGSRSCRRPSWSPANFASS